MSSFKTAIKSKKVFKLILKHIYLNLEKSVFKSFFLWWLLIRMNPNCIVYLILSVADAWHISSFVLLSICLPHSNVKSAFNI